MKSGLKSLLLRSVPPLRDLTEERTRLRDDRRRLYKERADLREERAILRQDCAQLRQDNTALRQDCTHLRKDAVHIRGLNERVESDLAILRNASAKLALSHQHLAGDGIEIGAFDQPLTVSRRARVQYLDRYTTEELRAMYPEHAAVQVDIVDDGETLTKIATASQDFVIASHMLEHCQNPIGTLANMFRVLKRGGRVFLVIPDMRFTFDSVRARTPFHHLLDDYYKGPVTSHRAHCEEWALVIDKLGDPASRQAKVEHLIETNWPIHFHVWNAADIFEMFSEIRKLEGFAYEVESFAADNAFEVTVVLRDST